ncbi:uncharacterized protein EDB91DRAFT_1257662 [Suillus paluster]|uniref:uncharacterized protein n=1 Tax=Suillus paluster TaxID=48578 RepID=UPI001B86FE29|nr:uncharacterized protein EDB91DRAFT_1257662 [Suillus paluster]KAG1719438.1 hypothetical protein EDB91DRAFT_1257662 [Suillus paluster]
MAPRKWTTSEQEVWLEPWYQKFAEKQSDKSRNHKNFFADLYEKWFEEFPEPRPNHITKLGPLTLEEHNDATDIRKAKLHTRFKNNFSGSKVGRQAKANANDIFDAVVRKITECEKPTRMLQEHKAYSKLYYADHVQKSIQETLKVAQATQSLTNGQRVALVKKETAALYAGESEDIKAKVKEYIHAQKEERGKEKAEPWSDEDQQQHVLLKNLTKLATVANQFLKGLADATGLSFSLLIGGPSVELGGMIDVWSFHVGMTKLGNNFSQAYPKFESEIVGPFQDYLYRVYRKCYFLSDTLDKKAYCFANSGGCSTQRPEDGGSKQLQFVVGRQLESTVISCVRYDGQLSNRDTSLSGTFRLPDLSEFPSSSNGPDLSEFLPSSNGPGSPTPFSSHNVLSGDNQQDWPLSDDLNDFLETLAQNLPMSAVDHLMSHVPPSLEAPFIPAVLAAAETLCNPLPAAETLCHPLPPVSPRSVHGVSISTPEPFDGVPSADSLPSGFTHPTAHLPGNAEEPNSDRPDAHPASSVEEDPTEDLCPSSIPTCTPPSADSCSPSIPTCTSSSADSCPPSIPSHTSPLANIANEAQENEVQTEAQADEGNDSGGPRRTRRAHIPSTHNTISNSIGNSLNLASKCSHGTDSSTRVGQQTKRPRV